METTKFECGWRCGDVDPKHVHYAVLLREKGKLLGRLTPNGGAARNTIYAAVLSKARAAEIAAEINAKPMFEGLTAKVIPF